MPVHHNFRYCYFNRLTIKKIIINNKIEINKNNCPCRDARTLPGNLFYFQSG